MPHVFVFQPVESKFIFSQAGKKASLKNALWVNGVGTRGGGTPYNGLYGEAPPERGTFFRLEVYKRVGISGDEVYEMAGKTLL